MQYSISVEKIVEVFIFSYYILHFPFTRNIEVQLQIDVWSLNGFTLV